MEYVQRVTAGVPRKDVAAAAGIDVSGLSRWINNDSRPRAEKVVAFARGMRQSPIEALIAANYLEPHEAAGVIEVVRSRADLSDDELLAELRDRLAYGPAKRDVDDITHRLARPDDPAEGIENGHGFV